MGDGEEGHIDTKTRPVQCRLRSTFFNLDLKLEKLGDSTTKDGKEFQQLICLLILELTYMFSSARNLMVISTQS